MPLARGDVEDSHFTELKRMPQITALALTAGYVEAPSSSRLVPRSPGTPTEQESLRVAPEAFSIREKRVTLPGFHP